MTSAALQATGTESVVAVLPAKSLEAELNREISAIELRAESVIIESDGDYADATAFARELQGAKSKVVAFWKPKKESAFKTHRMICESENAMLKPVNAAIATLKRAMGDFIQAQEAKRRAVEEEARRLAKEEADRKLAEAIQAEATGDETAAANAMLDAQMADSMSRNMVVHIATPKVEGASHSKDWELDGEIDSALVPIEIAGMELRPVDKAAVMRLIRASKGKIQIPGVKYKEVVKTTIRK